MSHWGARTGYGYEAQRVSFLRQMYKTERRHRELTLSPREHPGMAALVASMNTSPALPPSSPERIFSISPSPPIDEPSPRVAPPSSAQKFPAVSTMSQVHFRPHDPDFLERFKAGREHGRPHNATTNYREQVFEVWNITGTKNPAVFR